MDLRDKHVLVTGASGGIGTALVLGIAERGATVTLSGTRQDALDDLAKRVNGSAIVADLSKPEAPEQLLADAGPIDVLIANAALPASGLIEDFSIEQIDRALDINLRAPIVMAKLAAAQMAARGFGHLVFISSLSGKTASGRTALYSATKFGIRGFALSLREDLRPHGVGVSAIFPGPIRDAGMIADAKVKVPKIATRSTQNVATATIRAIERNIAEIDVAPFALRFSALLGGAAPTLSAAINRRTGSDGLMAEISEAQRDKR